MTNLIAKRFNINISGKGAQPILFAHGLGCDQNMWRFITPAFTDNYKVVVFDYIGSGSSDASTYNKEKYSSLEGYADDVIDIITSQGLTNVIFVGHSVSCMIGMLAAIKKPDLFKEIIMIGPSPCYLNYQGYNGGFDKKEIETLLKQIKDNFYQWSAMFAPVVMGNSNRPELSDELKKSFISTNRSIFYDFAEITFKSDLRNDVEKLETSCLLMQGTEDIVAPVGVGKYMHAHMKNSKLVLMEMSGHCAHMSEPEETTRIIKEYLEGEKN